MLVKLGLFLLGLAFGGFAVVTIARRLPPGGVLQKLLPRAARLEVSSGPEPLLRIAAPSARAVVPEPELAANATPVPKEAADVIVRNRTKSRETVELAGLPGWQADLRDRGHRRGFVIEIRREGEVEPVETVQAAGV